MFTGLIRNLGCITVCRELPNDLLQFTIKVASPTPCFRGQVGTSIACNGICLTAVTWDVTDRDVTFSVQVTPETCACTAIKSWHMGDVVNLETSLKAGDPLDGHLVLGHCDGVAEITRVFPMSMECDASVVDASGHNESLCYWLRPPAVLMPFLAPKGSVALDGVSLTINKVADMEFSVAFIPHTLRVTTWGGRRCGDRINIEVDVLARYAVRALQATGLPISS